MVDSLYALLQRRQPRFTLVLMLILGLGFVPSIILQARKDSWIREFILESRQDNPSSRIWLIKDLLSLLGQSGTSGDIGLIYQTNRTNINDVEFVYYTLNYLLYPRRVLIGPSTTAIRDGWDILNMVALHHEHPPEWPTSVRSVGIFFQEANGRWGIEFGERGGSS